MSNHQSASTVQAYSIKLTTSDGRSLTLSQSLLTRDQTESIANELKALALQSGMGRIVVDFIPVEIDDHDTILDQVRSFFSREGQGNLKPTFEVAVKCVSCGTTVALREALNTSQQAADFLSGDPITGDSRCERCSRHSIENCHECRTERLVCHSQDFNFLCEHCRARNS